MARKSRKIPTHGRRLQILKAATELFARQGFEGTTTKQIARHARVNEAIIFRHFPRKDDLYWAIIEAKCRRGSRRQELVEKLRTTADDRELFASIAADILRRNTEDHTLSRLLLFSALENHRLSHRFFRTYVARYYETLADYIGRRIREGAFRQTDPLIAARGFLGMISYHLLIQQLFGGERYQRIPPEKVCQELTQIWLQGMLAPSGNGKRLAPV
jgi:AcrR family transcriptional regulator